MNLPDDMEDFVALSPRTRSLTADAGDPTPNGYRLEIVCPCGVTFERCVTQQDAIDDMLREKLRAERN